MAGTGPPGPSASGAGPSQEDLEERWKELIESLTESPRDVDLLVKTGQLSEQLHRNPEAYTYYRRALNLDPSKGFLVSRLRALAVSPEQREEVTRISRQPTSFAASLHGIFKYPFRGKGLPILVIGAVFLWVARALVRHGIGTSGMTIAALVCAYMAMFYINVCHTTISGDEELPEWPDPLRIAEFGFDVLKFICATISAFLPIIVILIVFAASLFPAPQKEEFPAPDLSAIPVPRTSPQDLDDDEAARPAPVPPSEASARKGLTPSPQAPLHSPAPSLPLNLILALAGIVVFGFCGFVYLPMAKLANVVMGSPWTCFNYPFVVHSILATARNYLICLACYLGTSLMIAGAELIVTLADIIVITGCGLAFIELYGMTVLMRLLGSFYRMNQARLGWMSD